MKVLLPFAASPGPLPAGKTDSLFRSWDSPP
jgi:hypothetical protein